MIFQWKKKEKYYYSNIVVNEKNPTGSEPRTANVRDNHVY